DRHSYACALGEVALAQLQLRQCGKTQPVTEPVEERSNIACLIVGCVARNVDLLRRQWLDRECGKDHVFNPETGIDGIDPLLEARRKGTRIAARTGGAELYPLDPAVDPVEAEIEPPCSHPVPRQSLSQICREPFRCQPQIG